MSAVSQLKFSISMSLDGYVAGSNQSLENPIGEGGMALHEWAFATRTFSEMQGREGGETGLDDDQAAAWNENVGATIMGPQHVRPDPRRLAGRRVEGLVGSRASVPHTRLRAHALHARAGRDAGGGTTFYFVTDGIEAALARAQEAAGDRDVSIGGGASTIRQYLRAGLVDQMRIHVTPVLLGAGERLFDDVDDAPAAFECVELVSSPAAAHFTYRRRDA